MEPGALCNARAMSLMDSPAFHRSHNSFLPAADNPPGRPSLATPAPPIRTTLKTLPCCTDRLNPPRPFSPGKTGSGECLLTHRCGEGQLSDLAALCRILRVSRSGYYGWKGRSPSERDRENAALTEKIREIHSRSRQVYGYPRIHAELKALGVRCSRKRVARLM